MTPVQPMRIAHVARDENPALTLCGEPWEEWQDPDDRPLTHAEIDALALTYGARVALREDQDRRRREIERTPVRQCQACFHQAVRR